jgi:5'-nucleotidase
MTSSPRALITNDDGIDSPGLHRLAQAARDAGCEVVVAAPAREASGASASLTAIRADGRVIVEPRTLDGLAGIDAFGVDASPAFIALIACRGAFGPAPDVVLSGINRGHNAGQAVLHSGTVGAALTAAAQGCRAMAVSLAVAGDGHWATAADVASDLLPWLLAAPPRTVVNLNAPDLPVGSISGRRVAPLAGFGAVQTQIAEAGQGFVRVQITGTDADQEPGTDAALLAAGWVTVTLLQPVCEANGATRRSLATAVRAPTR